MLDRMQGCWGKYILESRMRNLSRNLRQYAAQWPDDIGLPSREGEACHKHLVSDAPSRIEGLEMIQKDIGHYIQRLRYTICRTSDYRVSCL